MNEKISQDTIFTQQSPQFQVGQENIRHKDYGDCKIVGVEPWKGKIFYYITIEASTIKFLVAGSKLEIKS